MFAGSALFSMYAQDLPGNLNAGSSAEGLLGFLMIILMFFLFYGIPALWWLIKFVLWWTMFIIVNSVHQTYLGIRWIVRYIQRKPVQG